MSDIDAHIGLLDGPDFNFYDGDYEGNIPKRISPFLPNAREIMSQIWKMIHNGDKNASQLDWGAVGVVYTKQQLTDFVDSFYENDYNDYKDRAREIRKYIKGLDSDKPYVLVAYETGDDLSC